MGIGTYIRNCALNRPLLSSESVKELKNISKSYAGINEAIMQLAQGERVNVNVEEFLNLKKEVNRQWQLLRYWI